MTIQAQHLHKRYGRTIAVDDVSVEVTPGGVTGLVGAPGAGKSTTIRLMLGLTGGKGRTLFDGVPYRRLARPLHEVGTVLQAPALHPGRRVRSHLRMLAAAHGIGRRRVDEVIDWVGLADLARRRPGVLSAGMRQRLALAGALLGDPGTLILDEPAAGLDPDGSAWLRGFCRAFAADGRTVLVTGRGLSEMAGFADRVLIMDGGRLIAEETADSVAGRGARLAAVLVRTPHIERLAELLGAHGARVSRAGPNQLVVAEMSRAEIGEYAFRAGIVVHELSDKAPSAEEELRAVGARRDRDRVVSEPVVSEPVVSEPVVPRELGHELGDEGADADSAVIPAQVVGAGTRP